VLSAETGAQRVPDDWFDGFHRGLAARFWRAAAAAMADDDWRRLERLLHDAAPPGATVLDVPCGDGRLTRRVADAGYGAIGIDLAPDEVALASRSIPAARFLVGDLRALPDVGPVDVVMSWGNSFGYLTPPDTARSLAAMHDLLRPGGRLLLESMTVAESLLPGGVERHAEYAFGGVRMALTNHYRAAESRLEAEAVFEDDDGVVERASIAHHVHTAGEVVRMLRDAGFGAIELRGADGQEPYALGSPRLIAVATA